MKITIRATPRQKSSRQSRSRFSFIWSDYKIVARLLRACCFIICTALMLELAQKLWERIALARLRGSSNVRTVMCVKRFSVALTCEAVNAAKPYFPLHFATDRRPLPNFSSTVNATYERRVAFHRYHKIIVRRIS